MAVYKDEKRKTWFYEGKYTDIFGNRKKYKKRGFKGKGEAKEAERVFLLSSKESSCSVTLNELFDEYAAYSKNRKKATSIYNDKRNYNKHIRLTLGQKKISKITTKDITNFHNYLLDKNYSTSYINTLHGVVSKLFNFAIKMKGFNNNPASKVGFVRNKNELKKEMQIWTYHDFERFISCVDDDRYQLAYSIAYMSGVRRGELLALTWNDYDGKGININKTCSKIKGGYIITPPKTQTSVRYIELDKNTIEQINMYKNDVSQIDTFNDDWYICGYNKPMSFSRLRERMVKYTEIANVPLIRFHDIRHSHASLLINKGMRLTAIARRLGHSNEMLLQVYSHFFKEDEKEIVNLLEKIQKSTPKVPHEHFDNKKIL